MFLDVSKPKTGPKPGGVHRTRAGQLIIWLLLLALVMMPFNATALTVVEDAVSTFVYTPNMHPLGFSERAMQLDNTVPGQSIINSVIAFWGVQHPAQYSQ